MDRARMKLGDKVTIPAVVEEIEHTTLGETCYKVEPLSTWFDADEIEALGQTESEDCISRKDAIEVVTRAIRDKFSLADWYEQLVETGLEIENLIKELPPVTPTDKVVDFNNMISAGGRIRNLPPVAPIVSEDCISRAEALDEFKKDYDDVFDLMTAIEELPSVTPTERTGEWVNSKGEPVNDRYSVYCSRCKAWSEYRDIYCGNCGAKMGGDDNE